jgi:hypothetical protein
MEQVCHRCGGAVHESDPFCPHCGAPQLRYEAPEEAAPSTGAIPAQRISSRDFTVIRWRDAIRAAAILAVPAGVLSSLLGLEALWVIAAGIAVISLYRRRTGILPTSRMGWRIGAIVGLFASVIATGIDGITLLIERYGTHQGAMIDQRYRDLGQQLTDQLTRSNPQAASVLPGFLHFWLTPDGVAAMVLINAAGLVVSMLIFAAAGGALGARLSARTAPASIR